MATVSMAVSAVAAPADAAGAGGGGDEYCLEAAGLGEAAGAGRAAGLGLGAAPARTTTAFSYLSPTHSPRRAGSMAAVRLTT